jgi:ATP-binding cassette subfamily B multidrug efflux pump
MYKHFERLTKAFPDSYLEQPPNTILAFCLFYSRGFIVPLIVLSFLTAMVAMFEVTLFSFMGRLVDWLAESDKQTFLANEWQTLLWMGSVPLLILPILTALHSLVSHQSLLGNYPMSIRWRAHQYLLRQSVDFYARDFAGRVAAKMMQTALAVRESVMKLLDVLVYISVYFVSAVVMVAQSNWLLMLPMLTWLACYIMIQFKFVPRLKNVSIAQANARADMTGRIVDAYSNVSTVKLFSHTDREAEYARDSMDGFMQTVYRQMRLATGLNVSVQIINHLLTFATGVLSIYLWLHDLVTVGDIAIAIAVVLRLHGMAHWIMWEVSALFENIGTVVDGMETLSKPLTVVDKNNAKPLSVNAGAIHFDQVDFQYDAHRKVIDKLTLDIKPGEKVGLVGRSGAGKSTTVNLLMRFYDVTQGSITIDGQNIADIQQESLRANIAMVTQDTSLLHRTVRENILYGRPDASEEDMIAAAKQAEAHDFIMQLRDPDGNTGYDVQVGERGVKLSGGQRQRIAIARVLLKDAPILVLDEATSALDSEIEAAIQSSLYTLMQGKSVIAIAHRLSTIAAMDRLVVMDEGKIVEQGTHQELLEFGGVYARLWKRQTGGFIGD